MTYNLSRAFARFFVAMAAGTLIKALEKYEPKWAVFTVIALLLAWGVFMVETRLKHEQGL